MRAFLGLAVLAAATLASAQSESFDAHCVDVTLLQDKKLQKEIGLTEAQRAKMNAAVGRQRKAAEEHMQKDKPDPQNDPQMAKIMADLRQAILKELTPAQLKRSREVSLQVRGIEAIADQKVAEKVGLSPKELAAYRSTLAVGAQGMGKVSQDAIGKIVEKYRAMKPKDEAAEKALREKAQAEFAVVQKQVGPVLVKMRDALHAKLEGTLTSSQKAKWKSFLGAPFRFAGFK